MHRLIAFVFKFILFSLILMMIFDTSLLVLDTVSVHSKVTSLAGIIQNEVAKNNCVPYALEGLFITQLNKIKDDSKVAVGIKTNIIDDLVIGDKTYSSVSQDNVMDYGALVYLAISVEMSPSRIYFSSPNAAGFTKEEGGSLNYDLNYVYSIPCLRYLK